ncbi:hypothetical protein ABZ419_03315 [Streptomyces cinnamoneus]|uniref:hypothetical protein n=1 Tax=Streptomyces cinnamoneus TaxID=53446 RepID=UPI00340FE770
MLQSTVTPHRTDAQRAVAACDLLGVDPGLRENLHRMTGMLAGAASAAETTAIERDMAHVLGRVVARRRAEPGDDLTSALLAGRQGYWAGVDDRELVGMLVRLAIAGHRS